MDLKAAGIAAGLIAAFVGGVDLGSGARRAAPPWRRPVVLGLVTFLLALAALAGGRFGTWLAMVLLAAAMGAENAVFEEDGEARIGPIYMTDALVEVGQSLAPAALGGPAWAWSPLGSVVGGTGRGRRARGGGARGLGPGRHQAGRDLVLIEPTEGLVAALETQVLERLDSRLAFHGQKLILISHRPSPMRLCDQGAEYRRSDLAGPAEDATRHANPGRLSG